MTPKFDIVVTVSHCLRFHAFLFLPTAVYTLHNANVCDIVVAFPLPMQGKQKRLQQAQLTTHARYGIVKQVADIFAIRL